VWPDVKKRFERQFVRSDIVKKMIECGMRVSPDLKIYVDDVEVDYSAVANAVDVDRRVVKQTVEQIKENDFLYSIFSKVSPLGSSLVNVVSALGYKAIIVEADPRSPGVMSSVAGILAKHGLVVRQALADDPDMVPDAKLTMVVEGELTGEVMEDLEQLQSIRSIKILK
jgi:predicted regulator of amino acid metabolism with ACT domain